MTQRYRICHNCGASLTPDQAYCPRCGAQYVEPIIQQPVIPPPPQGQAPYLQGQGYAPPPTPTPYYSSGYAQQPQMTPGQIGGSPQPPPPEARKGVSPFLIIALIVIALLLLVGIGSLFYNLGQQHGSKPGTTPTPGITPTPTPTPGTTPIPTPTPKITPGTTPTATSFRGLSSRVTVSSLTLGKGSNISVPHAAYSKGRSIGPFSPVH